MWIEFVGLPGAGKTTISRVLAARMEEAGYDCMLSPGFAHVARAGPLGRGQLLPALNDLVRSIGLSYRCRGLWRHLLPHIHQRHVFPRYWRLVRTWAGLSRIARRHERGSDGPVLILDQGILQCLPSVFPLGTGMRNAAELTIHGIDGIRPVLPDLVVVVSIDESTAADRMRSRPTQRTSFSLSDPQLEGALNPHRRYVEDLLPQALEGESTSILRLDGSVEPNENVDRILQEVRRICRSRAV